MPADEYSTPISSGGGKLKLKGVKGSKVDKHKKKKKKTHDAEATGTGDEASKQSPKEGSQDIADEEQADDAGEGSTVREKTEAEKRHEEMRRKRLDERLKREGVKTHKERVEELNRYLSNLSEHHDMPRIGPG